MEYQAELQQEQLSMLQQYAANTAPGLRCACLYSDLPVSAEKERSYHHWPDCLRSSSLQQQEESESEVAIKNPWEFSDTE